MPRNVKGFSRVDSGEAHGWLVRIKRGDIKRSRFISDSTHGGKRKSKAVAEQVYQDWVAELPAPDTAEDKLGKRNASGVVGVHYSHDVDSRYPNCAYEYYIASWKTEDGKRQNVRFSISKWGKKVAFELACLARAKRTTDRNKVQKLYEKQAKIAKKSPAKKSPTQKTSSKHSATKKKATAKKSSVKKKSAQKSSTKQSSTKKTAAKASKKATPKQASTTKKAVSKKATSGKKKAARSSKR